MQTFEPHCVSTRVGRKRLNLLVYYFRVFNFSTTHGNRQFKYQTLIICNTNVVYTDITQSLLLESRGFSDLADGLTEYIRGYL
jgi:hypothetical protein